MLFERAFAIPNAETFSVKPIGAFVQRYLAASKVSVDPFARDRDWATYTNDLNPATRAQRHMDAGAFCDQLRAEGVQADLGIFDPPYSPRQMAEVYQSIGQRPGREGTQNARLYRRVRDRLDALIAPGGVCLSFGWQSSGMGERRGYDILEILLVSHGGGHNDTICMAERKRK